MLPDHADAQTHRAARSRDLHHPVLQGHQQSYVVSVTKFQMSITTRPSGSSRIRSSSKTATCTIEYGQRTSRLNARGVSAPQRGVVSLRTWLVRAAHPRRRRQRMGRRRRPAGPSWASLGLQHLNVELANELLALPLLRRGRPQRGCRGTASGRAEAAAPTAEVRTRQGWPVAASAGAPSATSGGVNHRSVGVGGC